MGTYSIGAKILSYLQTYESSLHELVKNMQYLLSRPDVEAHDPGVVCQALDSKLDLQLSVVIGQRDVCEVHPECIVLVC